VSTLIISGGREGGGGGGIGVLWGAWKRSAEGLGGIKSG